MQRWDLVCEAAGHICQETYRFAFLPECFGVVRQHCVEADAVVRRLQSHGVEPSEELRCRLAVSAEGNGGNSPITQGTQPGAHETALGCSDALAR